MDAKCKFIKDITPQTKRWTAKVRVIEKSFQRTSKGSNKFQRLILVDVQGTRVQATIYGDDIKSLSNTLNILGHYYISNALVKPISESFRIVSHPYQWTISTKTPIWEVSDHELKSKEIVFPLSLVAFSELEKYVNSALHVDILAAVVDVFPPKALKNGWTIQEMLLINEESKPVVLTMWNDFVSNEGKAITDSIGCWPIIIGMRLKVSSFHGMSLTTKPSSTFLINVSTPEVNCLREWLTQNVESIQHIVDEQSSVPPASSPAKPTVNSSDIATISQIMDNTKDAIFWVKAKASLTKLNQKFWYMSCKKCWKGIHADYGQTFNCRKCGQESVAEPRSCLSVEIIDPTGSVSATVYGDNAEKLLSINAIDLMKSTDEDGKTNHKALGNCKSHKDYYIQLKFTYKENNGDKWRVVNVRDDLQLKIEKDAATSSNAKE